MSVKNYEPSGDVQRIVAKFETLDQQIQDRKVEFYERHSTEIDQLNALAESRNVALDESAKALRTEVERLDPEKFKTVDYHGFRVSKKKGSDYFGPVEFVGKAKAEGVKAKMEDEGVIKTKIEIDFAEAKEFLKKNGLTDKFASTLHEGGDLTPSVTGPKPVALFFQEMKKS